MRDVEVLCGAAREAHGDRRADVGELRLERAVAIEHLHALVAHVGHVDVAARVDGNRFQAAELARRTAGGAPLADEAPLLVELGHAVVGAKPVGDVDVAGGVPRHVGGTAERGPGRALAGTACRCAPLTPAAAWAARAGPGRAFRTWRRRTHQHRLGLAPEHERHAALAVELHDLAGADVDGPHVVLRIHAQADRGIEAVDVLAQFAHELAGGVELEQARAVAVEGAVVAERGVGVAGARVDEDLALRVGAHAAHFADVRVERRTQQIGVAVEGHVGYRGLGEQGGAASDECRGNEMQGVVHAGLF